MSDYVIVPIYNEFKCLVAGLNTISQILEYNNNIIVVATKLQKTKKDILMAMDFHPLVA
jgi:cellulose biosynthesis protein BcsQ